MDSAEQNKMDSAEQNNIIQCPHCEQYIEVIELNCRIFRCGIYKKTNIQVDPHLNEVSCNDLKTKDLIYGCGKPFQILHDGAVVVCGYI